MIRFQRRGGIAELEGFDRPPILDINAPPIDITAGPTVQDMGKGAVPQGDERRRIWGSTNEGLGQPIVGDEMVPTRILPRARPTMTQQQIAERAARQAANRLRRLHGRGQTAAPLQRVMLGRAVSAGTGNEFQIVTSGDEADPLPEMDRRMVQAKLDGLLRVMGQNHWPLREYQQVANAWQSATGQGTLPAPKLLRAAQTIMGLDDFLRAHRASVGQEESSVEQNVSDEIRSLWASLMRAVRRASGGPFRR